MKRTFVCHRGLFHFQRMPMGLSNTSQLFQRAMAVALAGLIGDDVLMYSQLKNDYRLYLDKVF